MSDAKAQYGGTAVVSRHKNPTVQDSPNNRLHCEYAKMFGCDTYLVHALEKSWSIMFPFVNANGSTGLTNEILLAIVHARLGRFQSGDHACEENAVAMRHLEAALDVLKKREYRMTKQGDASSEKARVWREGVLLRIGNEVFDVDALSLWRTWSDRILPACQKLTTPLTDHEMQVITENVPDVQAAKNGFAEFKSAMASTRKM